MDFKILIALEGNTYTENALPFVYNIVFIKCDFCVFELLIAVWSIIYYRERRITCDKTFRNPGLIGGGIEKKLWRTFISGIGCGCGFPSDIRLSGRKTLRSYCVTVKQRRRCEDYAGRQSDYHGEQSGIQTYDYADRQSDYHGGQSGIRT